jgi:hypothetical protein
MKKFNRVSVALAAYFCMLLIGSPSFADLNPPTVTTAPAAAPATPPVPETEKSIATAHAIPSDECVVTLTKFKDDHMSDEQTAALYQDMLALQNERDKAVTQDGNVIRLAAVKGLQLQEKLWLYLQAAKFDQIITFVRPQLTAVNALYVNVLRFGKQVNSTALDAPEYLERRRLFEEESAKFGIAYGDYHTILRTLVSVASGEGMLSGLNPVPNVAGDPTRIAYNLNEPGAINTAKRVLSVIDPEGSNAQLFINDDADNRPWGTAPNLASVEYMYHHNIYAVLGKLRNDVDQQKAVSTRFRKIMYWLANAYLSGTDRWLPESWRPYIINAVGAGYDVLMLEKYLDKIQFVVFAARRIDKDGNVVDMTSDTAVNLLIKTLNKFNSQADGNDFLETFVRLRFLSDVWAPLASSVAQKAVAMKKLDGENSNVYFDLVARMRDAEAKAKTKKDLDYLDDPETMNHIKMAMVNAVYTVTTPYLGYKLGQLAVFFDHWLHTFFAVAHP